jgi:hypothetical protein
VRDKAREATIIVGMDSNSHGKRLCGGVSDKQCSASNANALATVGGVDLSSVCLKPRPVAFKPLVLCPSFL